MNLVKQYVLDYIDKIFPPVFLNTDEANRTSWYKRLWREIKVHHRYIMLFSSGGESLKKSRYLLLFQLLSIQTMLMFLLAVCFDIQVCAFSTVVSLFHC